MRGPTDDDLLDVRRECMTAIDKITTELDELRSRKVVDLKNARIERDIATLARSVARLTSIVKGVLVSVEELSYGKSE